MLSLVAHIVPYSLRAFTQSNAGPARARNLGVSKARAKVIVFLDDDVEPSPQFLSMHANHHAQDSKIAVIGPMLSDPERKKEEPVWIAWEHAMLNKQYTAWRTGKWQGAGAHHFYSGNASVRREYLQAVGGFDEKFLRQEDVELAVRLEETCGVHFHYEAEAAGIHRPHRTWENWLKVPFSYGSLM